MILSSVLFPLPFGPMIPKNSPGSTRKLTSCECALLLVVDAAERVQEVLLERRSPLVRQAESLRHVVDLDGCDASEPLLSGALGEPGLMALEQGIAEREDERA